MKLTLREWQKIIKSRDELIINSSTVDGNDGYVPFPIGMSFRYIFWHKTLEEAQLGNHSKLALASFATYTDSRRRQNNLVNRSKIENTIKQNKFNNIIIDSPIDYFDLIPQYKFVFSPEGNGIDCHRHYEALIAGTIPIIEHNDIIKEKYKGCPILYTTDYSECTHEFLEQKYTEMLDQIWDFSPLFLSNYLPELQNQIKHNGNFWCARLTGRHWYS